MSLARFRYWPSPVLILLFLASCSVQFFHPSWALAEENLPIAPEPNRTDFSEEALQVAVVRITGFITEAPTPSLLQLAGGLASCSLADFTRRLDEAARDESVGYVLLSIEQPQINWAQVDELRQALDRLRRAGKKTYAYVEDIGQASYLLACACDEIIMSPAGTLLMNGLAGRTVYYKNLLDKLGIQADFLQMGDYKGAAEPYTRTGPSDAEKRQINEIIDSLYQHLIDSVMQSRRLERIEVTRLIDQGIFTAQEARQTGLIDRVMYRAEFLDYLKEQAHTRVDLYKDYGQSRRSEVNLDNMFSMMTYLQQLFTGPPEPPGDAIAILYIDGLIASGESAEALGETIIGSRTVRLALAKAQLDDSVKAVVVRIDSPGGDATASDVIYSALRQCAEVKPVVVSMGSVAASGGYYVACGSPYIFAQPTTLTGSIGVLGGKLNVGDLLEKIGVTTYGFQRGRNAHLFTMTRPFSPSERIQLIRYMLQIYEIFLDRVATSRADRLKGSIDTLAQGKVYTGMQAHALGLVDQIGGLHDAVDFAARQAGIEDFHLRVIPRPKNLIELLEEMFARASTSDNNPAAALLSSLPAFHSSPEIWSILGIARDYPVARLLKRGYHLITLLQRQSALCIMPYEILIN